MTALVAIATCPRPDGACYLGETATALDREGAAELAARVVFSDGPLEHAPPGWEIFEQPGNPRGSRTTMWRAFRHALDAGVDRLLYCEDDIRPSRNAVRAMLAFTVPERAAFIDFHDMGRLARVTRPGLYLLPLGRRFQAYSGTQCMLFPRRSIEWLVEQDPASVAQQGLPNCVDAALGRLLSDSPWPRYAAHQPCLVRHVGVVSAAHSKLGLERRLPSHYPGDDFDTLTLVPT